MSLLRTLLAGLYYNPVTTLLTLACAGIALLTGFGALVRPDNLLFYPSLGQPSDLISIPVLLRTLGPALLHFGLLHLVFNLLWLWFFGRQLERMQGAWRFLGLVCLFAFVSNTAQYLASGQSNFGGLSGVVYGLVGYTWCIHRFMPRSYLMFSDGMFFFFLLMMAVMPIGPGIANAAHLGGLASGLAVGLLTVGWCGRVRRQEAVGRPWR